MTAMAPRQARQGLSRNRRAIGEERLHLRIIRRDHTVPRLNAASMRSFDHTARYARDTKAIKTLSLDQAALPRQRMHPSRVLMKGRNHERGLVR